MKSCETIKAGEHWVTNTSELEQYLLDKSKDGKAYVKSPCFDIIFIYAFKNPSSVPARFMDDNTHVFYKGIKKTFSHAKTIEHQNSGLCRD